MRIAGRRSLLLAPLLPLPSVPLRAEAPEARRAAGLLVTGQSNAGFFLEDGGIWTLNGGLAAMLGLPPARFDPRLAGFRDIDGYALRDGAHRDPPMATTVGGTPLWNPGDEGAFLAHRPGADPAAWPRGRAGEALDRFVRSLLTPADRAACLGILWLHTEDDTRTKRMRDAATHAAAIRRHLALLRAAFGRPDLPAWGWAPIPYGSSAEGHRAVRAALAEVAGDPSQRFGIAIAQTADSEARDGGRDWSHRAPEDLRLFARRAAIGIARGRFGPRILAAREEGPDATLVAVALEPGAARLAAEDAALDGRGWSVRDGGGAERRVTGIALRGADRILVRHEPCRGPRSLGYCLLGEQLGRGHAVREEGAAARMPLPPRLGPEWRMELPLRATLLPVPVQP